MASDEDYHSESELYVRFFTSVFITISSLEIFQFLLRLQHKLVAKNKNVIHQPRSVRIGKNCAFCLAYVSCVCKTDMLFARLVNNIYISGELH